MPLLALSRQRLRHRSEARHVHNLWLRPCVFWLSRLHGIGVLLLRLAVPGCMHVCDTIALRSYRVEPKAKEPPVPQIDLEFRTIGLDGSHVGRRQFRASQFRTLDVCNVPRRGQTTACPIPSDPALELVSKPRDGNKCSRSFRNVSGNCPGFVRKKIMICSGNCPANV